jgi:phospholipid transport system substrate-binding protein
MAKRSLGGQWSRQSARDQQQFVKAFTDLIVDFYTDRCSVQGERIRYLDETVDGRFAHVKTTSATPGRLQRRIQLHQTSSGWKVYDVGIEDVSLINNFRPQFTRTSNNISFADLLHAMRKRAVRGE